MEASAGAQMMRLVKLAKSRLLSCLLRFVLVLCLAFMPDRHLLVEITSSEHTAERRLLLMRHSPSWSRMKSVLLRLSVVVT
jgi:hypothetical protein